MFDNLKNSNICGVDVCFEKLMIQPCYCSNITLLDLNLRDLKKEEDAHTHMPEILL